jgi:hypothetical protein
VKARLRVGSKKIFCTPARYAPRVRVLEQGDVEEREVGVRRVEAIDLDDVQTLPGADDLRHQAGQLQVVLGVGGHGAEQECREGKCSTVQT